MPVRTRADTDRYLVHVRQAATNVLTPGTCMLKAEGMLWC